MLLMTTKLPRHLDIIFHQFLTDLDLLVHVQPSLSLSGLVCTWSITFNHIRIFGIVVLVFM